ncbi:MAG: KEOPS complex N(6)-L-threonylcarbamoyladenine synthase Kae1 [Candidatus Aenigmarchaeota archaeon]|nr:KEOPS complex N(6)-L-threonylcarbamoyladenine synthase Kae1 [Candidatus Aenigmarchaeota archaeon]
MSLGIESTAHTFGIGVVEDKKILADEKSFYKPPLGQGMLPRKVFEFHSENAANILKNALIKANISLKDIDVVSFSQGPGLPNCLTLGAFIARYISIKYKKPLVGVNHPVAHLEIGKLLTDCKDPVTVYCSGGNTQIIAYESGRYRVFGETLDIPIGNAFDVLARSLGLEMPGGPVIEKIAKKGKWVDLPYIVKGMDFSFSGIVTECQRLAKRGVKIEDIAYSFQESCFSMLIEAAERALAHTEKKEILVTGGVAANQRLNEMLEIMCKERDAKLFSVPLKYSGDNGVMIAYTGLLMSNAKCFTRIEDSFIKKDWRIDEVDVKWM